MPLVKGRDTVLTEECFCFLRVELNKLEQEAKIHIPDSNPMEMLPQGPHTALCLGCSSHQVTG